MRKQQAPELQLCSMCGSLDRNFRVRRDLNPGLRLPTFECGKGGLSQVEAIQRLFEYVRPNIKLTHYNAGERSRRSMDTRLAYFTWLNLNMLDGRALKLKNRGRTVLERHIHRLSDAFQAGNRDS